MAERHIQTVKNVLKKADEEKTDKFLALLSLRNTPISGLDASPAQLLFSRRLRDLLPIVKKQLEPQVISEARKQLQQIQERTKENHDLQHSTQHRILCPGSKVRFRIDNGWRKGKIKSNEGFRRYRVVTDDGQEFVCNRRFLFPTQSLEPWI